MKKLVPVGGVLLLGFALALWGMSRDRNNPQSPLGTPAASTGTLSAPGGPAYLPQLLQQRLKVEQVGYPSGQPPSPTGTALLMVITPPDDRERTLRVDAWRGRQDHANPIQTSYDFRQVDYQGMALVIQSEAMLLKHCFSESPETSREFTQWAADISEKALRDLGGVYKHRFGETEVKSGVLYRRDGSYRFYVSAQREGAPETNGYSSYCTLK